MSSVKDIVSDKTKEQSINDDKPKTILHHVHANRKIITYLIFMILCIMYIIYLEYYDKDEKKIDSETEISTINIRDKLSKDEQIAWKTFVIESVNESKKEKSKREKLYKKLKTSAGFTLISTALRWNDAISISEIVVSTFIANVIIFLSDY